MLKRMIDLMGSLAALVLLLPASLVIALVIKLESPGPIFYVQVRVGQHGRAFKIYKFRSMVADAERVGPPLTGRLDRRVTRAGAILRMLRIDELPQLLNVLKGDMSLVGPRPELCAIVEKYRCEHREILRVKPGITGPTQLSWLDESRRYPPGIEPQTYYVKHFLPAKLQSDLHYVRTRSLRNDIAYLIQTPMAIARMALARTADKDGCP
jgi:lipopolysaccharide/colanic/teichoic acid biosynthesis glycosyltransferase